MLLLRVFQGMARRTAWIMAGTSAARRRRTRVRRGIRRGRRLTAGGMGPVLAVAQFTIPVALVAAVAVVGVARAAPAKAAGPAVLVLLQNGETTAPETTILTAAGDTVTQATPATWEGMSASAFKAYAALVIGDPSSGGTCSSLTPTTGTTGSDALGTNWQSAVSGNVAMIGTAPAAAGTSAAHTLVTDAAGYAAAAYSSGSQTGTGLYVSLNCEYTTTSSPTAVPLLGGVEGIGTAGGLAVRGSLACSDAGTVNTWEQHAAGTFGGFTSSKLATGSWPPPACPAEEGFTAWPAMFTPLAYDSAPDTRQDLHRLRRDRRGTLRPARRPRHRQHAGAGPLNVAVRCRSARPRAGPRTRPHPACRRPARGIRWTPRTATSPSPHRCVDPGVRAGAGFHPQL